MIDDALQFRSSELSTMLGRWKQWTAEGASDRVAHLQSFYESAANDHRLITLVRALYPQCMHLTRGCQEYPCAVFPAPTIQQNLNRHSDSDAVTQEVLRLTPVERQEEDLLLVPNYQEWLNERAKTAKKGTLYDGRQYILRSILPGTALGATCDISSYFKALASCEALGLELFKAWFDAEGGLTDKSVWELLPHRLALHQCVADPVINGDRRAAALSVGVLICFPVDSEYRCLLLKRSKTALAVDRERLHVIPAGMFEPFEPKICGPYDIMATVERELSEECFVGRDHNTHHGPDYWHRRECIKELCEQIGEGNASFHFAGISTNLFNLRSEFGMLLFISDEAWGRDWVNSMRYNWEYQADVGMQFDGVLPSIAHDDKRISREMGIRGDTMVPVGAGTFWLGVDVARILAERNPLDKPCERKGPLYHVRRLAAPSRAVEHPRPMSRESAHRMAANCEVAVEVDESFGDARISVRRGDAKVACQLNRQERALLWLVLTQSDDRECFKHVGSITWKQIDDIEGKTAERGAAAYRQMKTRLAAALDGLQLLAIRPGYRGFDIASEALTSCWVRSCKDPRDSQLLPRSE